ncbi:uncharacterized protein GJ701_012529 isoform 2-T4 [Geothlypis trichas]
MMRSGPPPPAASSSSSWCGRCDPPRPGSAVAVTVPAGTRPAGPLSPRAAPARHAPRAASGARTGGSSAASAPPLPARARARASLPLARLSLPLVPSAIPPPPAAPRSRSPARRRRPARCPPARPRPEPPPPHPPVLPTNHTAAAPGRARVTSPRGRVTQAAPGRGPGRSRARAPPPLRGKREGPAGPAAREMRSLGSAATHVGTWRGKRLPPRAAQGRLDRQERRSVPGSRRRWNFLCIGFCPLPLDLLLLGTTEQSLRVSSSLPPGTQVIRAEPPQRDSMRGMSPLLLTRNSVENAAGKTAPGSLRCCH